VTETCRGPMVGSRQVCVCPVCEGFLDWGAGVYPSEMPDLSQPVRPPGVTESTRFGSTPPETGHMFSNPQTPFDEGDKRWDME
jgi:hypothetical protein